MGSHLFPWDSSVSRETLTGIGLVSWILILLSLSILYQLLRTVYSVYFGPLSKIPGPKLAAATFWYEIYYDAYKPGLYWREVRDMHKKYGILFLDDY